MEVIHALSGGIDSTSVLYQLLRSGLQVTTIHIDIKNAKDERWIPEREATEAIIAWLRNDGYTFNHIDGGITQVTGSWWDIEVVALHVGNNLRLMKDCVAVSESTNLDDQAGKGWRLRAMNRRWITEVIAGRSLTWLRPNAEKKRDEVIRSMPAELLQLTSFCRNPDRKDEGVFVPCGECKTCLSTLPIIRSSNEPLHQAQNL